MKFLANMHPVSVVVIIMILMLFAVAVIMLFAVSCAYRRQTRLAVVGDTHRSHLVRDALEEFTTAYNTFGQETNTPAIVTSAILKGVSTYNEYYMANLYLQDKTKYQVVATSLYVFSGPMGNQYNYICAGVIITIIPALIVFLLCQDQIYSGMAAGAVKG